MSHIRLSSSILVSFTMFMLVSALLPLRAETPAPTVAIAGVLDMSSASSKKGEVIELLGQWDYYWGKLLEPNSPPTEPDGLYNMPSTWDITQAGFPEKSGQGFATFVITLINLPSRTDWGLSIPEQSTAFRLYVNERLVATGGQVASRSSDAAAYSGNQLVDVGHLESTAKITFQVSNFHHDSGGPWQTLSIGPYRLISKTQTSTLFYQALVVSLSLIASAFLLTQWLVDRREWSTLMLSCFALMVAIRLGIADNQPLYQFFGKPPWWLHIRLLYISKLLAVALVPAWLQRVYPREFNRNITTILVAAFIACSLLVMTSSTLFFTGLLSLLYFMIAATILYVLYGVVKIVWHRRAGAISIGVGTSALCASTAHDLMLYAQLIHNSKLLMPLGILTFLLTLMLNLINLRASEKRQVETLSEELLRINRTLENNVQKRTQELAEKAQALEEANQQLQVLANIDSLTQVLNRRAFIEQCSIFSKTQPTVTLVLIDVDHFKKINDNYGHAIGDEVLIRLAKHLTKNICSDDRVARIGGEEFVILLDNAGPETAEAFCEKLIAGIRILDISDITELQNLTISAGAVSGILTNDKIDKMLQSADKAMYLVKSHGRDGYRMASLSDL